MRNMRFLKVPVYVNQRFIFLYFYFFFFSIFRNLLNVRQLEGLSSEISLLHMNCEGCEWEMLESLLKDADVINKV